MPRGWWSRLTQQNRTVSPAPETAGWVRAGGRAWADARWKASIPPGGAAIPSGDASTNTRSATGGASLAVLPPTSMSTGSAPGESTPASAGPPPSTPLADDGSDQVADNGPGEGLPAGSVAAGADSGQVGTFQPPVMTAAQPLGELSDADADADAGVTPDPAGAGNPLSGNTALAWASQALLAAGLMRRESPSGVSKVAPAA